MYFIDIPKSNRIRNLMLQGILFTSAKDILMFFDLQNLQDDF